MNKLAIKIAVPLIGLVVALVGLFVGIFFIQAWWSQPTGIFDVAGISDGPEPVSYTNLPLPPSDLV